MSNTTCPACGQAIATDANFCPNCGDNLRGHTGDTTRVIPVVVEDLAIADELSADEVSAIESLPQGSALLIVQRGPDTGARYLLNNPEVKAGRHPSNDIFLDDITVSRHHCTFTIGAEQVTVTDAGSLNGTYVNRTLIDGAVVLRPGDEVQIGKFRLVYFVSTHGLG